MIGQARLGEPPHVDVGEGAPGRARPTLDRGEREPDHLGSEAQAHDHAVGHAPGQLEGALVARVLYSPSIARWEVERGARLLADGSAINEQKTTMHVSAVA